MNSGELANKCLEIYLEAQRRIVTVGDTSYSDVTGEFQRHEVETLEDHLTGLEEELLDTINWAAMSILKLRERREEADRTAPWPGSPTA